LRGRDRIVEPLLSFGFLGLAVPMAVLLDSGHSWSLPAIPLLIAYVIASRIEFEVGGGYTVPTQLLFVPMLFVLPTGSVPLAVACCFVAAKLPGYLTGRIRPGRALADVGDAWHAVGPALVLALAGATHPQWGEWPVYVGALGAQFGLDLAASTARQWLELGTPPIVQLRVLGLVYLIDALLAPLGLMAAFLSVDAPYAFLLLLPLVGLLAVFASERRARIDHAIELSGAYRGTALLLGDVVEADDHYTGAHTQGVTVLATLVAEEMELDAHRRRNVEFTALLHDVGKIAMPKDIINKPGALDDTEWKLMRTHTIEGERMLARVGGVLGEVAKLVRATHERWDGRGYPDGLRGDDIPLEARIVACCDAYDAMTTDRSYRRALPIEFALEELRACAGTQFDPAVVDALVRIVERYEPTLTSDAVDEALMRLLES
jgi:HD-GYP domain-containing protein (c-di-GMP phosphodiesterase class II)